MFVELSDRESQLQPQALPPALLLFSPLSPGCWPGHIPELSCLALFPPVSAGRSPAAVSTLLLLLWVFLRPDVRSRQLRTRFWKPAVRYGAAGGPQPALHQAEEPAHMLKSI